MESTTAMQSAVGRVIRFAPSEIAARYPLPARGSLDWQSNDTLHRVEIELPEIAAGQIVVPSFSMLCANEYGFQFAVESGPNRWPLATINPESNQSGNQTGSQPGQTDKNVTTHIDYFEVHQSSQSLRLVLDVSAPQVPDQYLLTVSIRDTATTPEPGHRTSQRLIVSPLSQMNAPARIRHHLCSPTSLTMVLRHYGVDTHLSDVARGCYHAEAGMYGIWPAALYTASRTGCIGAVETFNDTHAAAELTDADIPVIASIRFEPGELTGTPQRQSGGHLLVVTGWDADQVHVNDPRAPDPRDVCSSYDRAQFAQAWLRHRGAAYVVLPP